MTRSEFDRLRGAYDDLRNQLVHHRTELDVQFKRIAQMQAEVDALQRRARKRLRS